MHSASMLLQSPLVLELSPVKSNGSEIEIGDLSKQQENYYSYLFQLTIRSRLKTAIVAHAP